MGARPRPEAKSGADLARTPHSVSLHAGYTCHEPGTAQSPNTQRIIRGSRP